MVMVSELALLDLKDALKLALVQSGKTPLEVALEMISDLRLTERKLAGQS